MNSKVTKNSEGAYKFSVAPMMDYTDRHFRVIMRLISNRALLYTEMIVVNALKHSKKRDYLLYYDPIEHPISLQIGGDDPKLLADASKIAQDWGYDEINLNIGCPSPKVKHANFGACLMANPDHVARCIEAMTKATDIPVTIKHRIGIDNLDSDDFLHKFVNKVHQAGAKRFAIHARKAWLNGLNPKQNRTIPPLEYQKVERLKNHFPHLKIELNGGLKTPKDCLNSLKVFDGAMVGRAAYSHPLLWQHIDELVFGEASQTIKASQIIRKLIPYTEKHLNNNGKLWDISKHLINIVQGVPGAKAWRHNLSSKAQKKKGSIKILEEASEQLENEGL